MSIRSVISARAIAQPAGLTRPDRVIESHKTRRPLARSRQLRGRWGQRRHRVAQAVQADIGDVRRDPALAERAGDSDAVMPIEDVVPAAAPVQVHRIHSAAGPDVGGYPLKPRSGHFRGGPETTVEAPGPDGLDRSNDLADRHHRLCARPGAAYRSYSSRRTPGPAASSGPHFTQHWQAVAAGWTAAQPPGQLGQARPPPGTVKSSRASWRANPVRIVKTLAPTRPDEHRRWQVQRSRRRSAKDFTHPTVDQS